MSITIIQEKQFPDVSYYQGEINWDVTCSKTNAIVIRAGQSDWEDPQFRHNWEEAKKRGMKRGAYWFYDDRMSPGAQAQAVADLLQGDLPEMELWCDWESTYGGEFTGLKNVVAFMEAVEDKLPTVQLGMYTGYYWFRDNTNANTHASQYAYLKERPLWLAYYTEDDSNVLIPAPWTGILVWQYGTPAIGPDYGVETAEIDMNYFNGTQAEFDQRYGAALFPAEPTVGEEEISAPVGEAETVTLKHTIEVYSDGSLKIDGKPYA